MSNSLVSVIIPTYNRATFLRKAIESVVAQTYSSIEILVIDDGSSSNYAEAICQSYPNCTYNFKENGGLSSSRNYGIKKAKGAFIAFLDDDDYWREDKIEKQISAMSENPDVDLVHSAAAVVDERGLPTGKQIGASTEKAHLRSGNVFWNALGVWVVKSPTPLIRKSVFQSDLLFDETILVGEDIDFYPRLFYRHKVWYIDEPLAYYRIYESENRLSVQRKQYVGIELKTLKNLQEMGVKNRWTLHRIAIRLLNQAINNYKLAFPNNPIRIHKLIQLIRPKFCLNNYFKVES